VLAALFAWRDRTARAADESPGYVLPRAVLLRLCDVAATLTDVPMLRRWVESCVCVCVCGFRSERPFGT